MNPTAGSTLRALSGLERTYYLWGREHPFQFSVAAHLNTAPDPAAVRAALLQVQQAHPLLAATVDTDASTFVHTDVPISLRLSEPETDWHEVLAEELAIPFDRNRGPLARAVLAGPTIVFTLEHTIADGLSVVLVLAQIVASLNGEVVLPRSVLPVPKHMLRDLPVAQPDDVPTDPRLFVPSKLRPFDGRRPSVTSLEWDLEDTSTLVQQCRDRNCSVTGALGSAAAHRVAQARGHDFVRLNIPVSLDHLTRTQRDVGLYIGLLRPGFAATDLRKPWQAASQLTQAAKIARQAPVVHAGVLVVDDWWAQGLDESQILEALIAANSFEILLSNLGDLDGSPRTAAATDGPVCITAFYGPALLDQVEGERMIGVSTWQGRLRMLCSTHDPIPGFLDDIRKDLLSG